MKNAGFTIIKVEYYRAENNHSVGYCIGKRDTDFCPYVVWGISTPFDSTESSFYWGHYFDEEKEAYKDFYERLKTAYDLPY